MASRFRLIVSNEYLIQIYSNIEFSPKKICDKWAFRISPHPHLSKFIAFPFLFIDIYRVFIKIYRAKYFCSNSLPQSKPHFAFGTPSI